MTARIHIHDEGFGRGEVHLDGYDVSAAVVGYSITGHGQQRPEVTLDLNLIDLSTLSEPGRILFQPGVVELLVRLGFTPPPEYHDGDTTSVFVDPAAADPDLDLRTLGDPIDDAAAYHRGKAEALEETYEYVGKHGTSDLLEWLRRRANAFRGPR